MLPNNYEEAFWEEIWGCVNHIKLPYETVMKMPVYERKIWIQRHNIEQKRQKDELEGRKNSNSFAPTGDAINSYAENTQAKIANGTNF